MCPLIYALMYVNIQNLPSNLMLKIVDFSQSSNINIFRPNAVIQGYKLCVLTNIYIKKTLLIFSYTLQSITSVIWSIAKLKAYEMRT